MLVLAGRVELTGDQREQLLAVLNSRDVSPVIATRGRIVLWRAEGRPKKEVAELAGVIRPTVIYGSPATTPKAWPG